jgi:hypothetical protein
MAGESVASQKQSKNSLNDILKNSFDLDELRLRALPSSPWTS